MGSGKGQSKRVNVLPKAPPPKAAYKKLTGVSKIAGAKINIGHSLWDKHLIENKMHEEKTCYSDYYLGKHVKTEDASDKAISYILTELMTDMIHSDSLYHVTGPTNYEVLSDIEKKRLLSFLKDATVKIERNEKRFRKYQGPARQEIIGTNYVLVNKEGEEISSCFQEKPLLISGKMFRDLRVYKNITPLDVVKNLIDVPDRYEV